MLALQKQPACHAVLDVGRSKFIQKKIQLPNGLFALIVFELIEINGKIIAKAVCGKIIEERSDFENLKRSDFGEKILALPIYFERENFKPIISPFFADVLSLVKDLSFIISQPTRAPNF